MDQTTDLDVLSAAWGSLLDTLVRPAALLHPLFAVKIVETLSWNLLSRVTTETQILATAVILHVKFSQVGTAQVFLPYARLFAKMET